MLERSTRLIHSATVSPELFNKSIPYGTSDYIELLKHNQTACLSSLMSTKHPGCRIIHNLLYEAEREREIQGDTETQMVQLFY